MALPSQSARISQPGRAVAFRRKKGPAPVILGAAAVLVVSCTVLGFRLLAGGAPAPAQARANPAVPVEPTAGQPARTRLDQQPPLEFRMGGTLPQDAVATPPPKPEPRSPTTPTTPTAAVTTEAAKPEPKPEAKPEPKPELKAEAPALPADLQGLLTGGRQKLSSDPVAARAMLSRALADPRLPQTERPILRDQLTRLNQDLIFSPRIVPTDPYAEVYTVRSGDSLVRIASRQGLAADWRLIQRVNGISNPNHIGDGQKLKLVRGPFHAVVSKSDFRLDVYMGPPERPADWLYVRSFRVGLGEAGSTPTAAFAVRKNSKLINPHWVNPRTGERFDADNPKNPIGEHWIGLAGLGESAAYVGYGLHGTIEPQSIGQERSMGCVRLGPEDIALLYELLVEEVSIVKIE